EEGHDLALGHLERDTLEHENDVIVDDLDVVDAEYRLSRRQRGGRRCHHRLRECACRLRPCGHQLVTRQPCVIFFSAAYLAAASLTMGAITASSEVIQSDATFHFLPSQV